MTPDACVDVAVPLPLFRTFTYQLPPALASMAAIGKRVLVPFGNRRITGYLLGPAAPSDGVTPKPIIDILDQTPLFTADMVPFLRWAADYYIHPIGEVIAGALPNGLNLADQRMVSLAPAGETVFTEDLPPVQQAVMTMLQADPRPVSVRKLSKTLSRDIPLATLHTLEKKGWVSLEVKLKGGQTKHRTEILVCAGDPGGSLDGLTEKRRAIVEAVRTAGEVPLSALKPVAATAAAMVRDLETGGYVTIRERVVYRDPLGDAITPDQAPPLTDEQAACVETLGASLASGDFSTFLLEGVTGSGKTEVYLDLVDRTMASGRTALVLVPEIALITQTERRFRARFGEQVAVLHSGLSTGEKYDQWMRIARNEAPVVIGARSAIFAPLARVGLIVVDEEHDGSYKQDAGFRYNARDLASVRGRLENATVVLGSATPSLETAWNAETGKFRKVQLTRRVNRQALPETQVIDLNQFKDAPGMGRFITPPLIQAIDQTLKRGEQSLIFLNRRGYANWPVCNDCGEALRCEHCDITLTLHKSIHAYKCHMCGFTRSVKTCCATCGSSHIKALGLGTEKVAAALEAVFPHARIARMDQDTTVRKGELIRMLKALRNQTIDILVGTQMVAKGHDFPNITLVGILSADMALHIPDFRAGERTFQILAQVAGRAGRGARPGRVLMQTQLPEHFCIETATRQDFHAFYDQEARQRQVLEYPPYARILQFQITGKNSAHTAARARELGAYARAIQAADKSLAAVRIMGPIEAALVRVARYFRWQLLLKSTDVTALHRLARQVLFDPDKQLPVRAGVQVRLDVDPYTLM